MHSPGVALLWRQQRQVVSHRVHHAHGRPYLIDQTAQALMWLSSVPPPPNHVIGPLRGGCIHYEFFNDYTALLLYSIVEALL